MDTNTEQVVRNRKDPRPEVEGVANRNVQGRLYLTVDPAVNLNLCFVTRRGHGAWWFSRSLVVLRP